MPVAPEHLRPRWGDTPPTRMTLPPPRMAGWPPAGSNKCCSAKFVWMAVGVVSLHVISPLQAHADSSPRQMAMEVAIQEAKVRQEAKQTRSRFLEASDQAAGGETPDDLKTPWTFHWSGYAKNLFTRSDTLAEEHVIADLSRLRLNTEASYREALDLYLSYDQEAILGSILRTDQFRTFKDVDSGTWIDADHEFLEAGRDLVWRHRLYRGYAKLRTPGAILVIGRQRIAWGTARFWNPVDLFNPISPLAIEREEKIGVDALDAELRLPLQSRAELVYAPQTAWNKSSLGGRLSTVLYSYEISAVTGKFGDDNVFGATFDGHLLNGELRGEGTVTNPKGEDAYLRAVIGYEYDFANTLTVFGEYFYNGNAAPDPTGEQRLLSRTIFTTQTHFLGAGLGYDVTPLLRVETYGILAVEDAESAFLNPLLRYNLRPNLDVLAGAQLFLGPARSEYGLLPNVYYAQLQWFF